MLPGGLDPWKNNIKLRTPTRGTTSAGHKIKEPMKQMKNNDNDYMIIYINIWQYRAIVNSTAQFYNQKAMVPHVTYSNEHQRTPKPLSIPTASSSSRCPWGTNVCCAKAAAMVFLEAPMRRPWPSLGWGAMGTHNSWECRENGWEEIMGCKCSERLGKMMKNECHK